MCITRRKKRQRKNKIYPYISNKTSKEIKNTTHEEFLREFIECHHCKKFFNVGSNQIKIHCAGCDQFFHCGIAGKCRGDDCNLPTMIGKNHRLSWCINCVPKIEGNQEKVNGEGTCICENCNK